MLSRSHFSPWQLWNDHTLFPRKRSPVTEEARPAARTRGLACAPRLPGYPPGFRRNTDHRGVLSICVCGSVARVCVCVERKLGGLLPKGVLQNRDIHSFPQPGRERFPQHHQW